MRCPGCEANISMFAGHCPNCGRDLSPYVHLLGVLGGAAGGFVGFTFYGTAGALLGGLLGILVYVGGAKLLNQRR
jgi:hypothetical protein